MYTFNIIHDLKSIGRFWHGPSAIIFSPSGVHLVMSLFKIILCGYEYAYFTTGYYILISILRKNDVIS